VNRVLTRSVAWASWVLSAMLLILGLLLWSGSALIAQGATITASGAAYATVALVLALRRPDNPLHWVLRVIGLSLAGLSAAQAYPLHPAADPGLVVVASWLASWLYLPGVVSAFTLLPLLFPSGRPPSRRWSPVLWLALLLLIVGTGAEMFAPGPLWDHAPVDNPYGIGGPVGDAMTRVHDIFAPLLLIAVVLSCAAFVVRFRRSRALERAQLKWFAYVLAIAFVGLALTGLLFVLGWRFEFIINAYLVALGALPVTIGVAILRHRLYDIDVLVNRTLVYGATTATLLGLYAAIVLVALTLLRPVTQGSELPVAVSTLVVASLMHPVRRRIQTAVDRRFYRSRYDAARTVDALAARMRDEVDLDAVRRELVAVARDTMQPAHASLWLRERVS
jgi:hypothetical protein